MKIAELFFLVVLVTLPIQLSKFFFFEHSFVLGIPIDYRAVTIYLSDIAIILFLTAQVWQNYRRIPAIISRYKDYIAILIIFNIYLLLSAISLSTSKEASYFFSLKFAIFSLFSVFAANVLQSKGVREKSLVVIAFSLLWQSALVIAQFASQGSIGLTSLGERSFDSATVLIAHSDFLGQQFLRPYGSFPHPNVAAAYLVFSAIILASSTKAKLNLARISLLATALLAILLIWSKSAFALLALGLLAAVKSLQNLIILLVAGVVFGFFIISQLSLYQIASVAERLLLSQAALDIALVSPAMGVGSANFILELSRLNLFSLAETRLLQPVHNVFLLILAENGIVGLMLFTALLLVVAKYLKGRTKTVIFIGLLFYLSVDHFLWTLQQGQLIFFSFLAYFLADTKRRI